MSIFGKFIVYFQQIIRFKFIICIDLKNMFYISNKCLPLYRVQYVFPSKQIEHNEFSNFSSDLLKTLRIVLF